MILHSQRLACRQPEPGDRDAVLRIYCDPRTLGSVGAVHAMVQAGNPASIRVLEKVGLRPVGMLPGAKGTRESLHYCLEFIT